jgi:phosphoribosylanthranilate isomerase
MPLKIKICGITNSTDAGLAIAAGVHALGFMFFKGSSRYVTYEAAKSIIREIPPFISKVGVFVDAPREEVVKAIAETGIDTLQFHGDEPPEACRGFGLKTIKAFRVKGKDMLQIMPRYDVDAWLLDSFVSGQRGGTGKTFDWDLAVHATSLGTPVILAGGLNPDNIARAISQVEPFGVDVCSGVESKPGKKDPKLLATFIQRARGKE